MDTRLLQSELDKVLLSFSKSLSPPKELIKKWNNEFHVFVQNFQQQLRRRNNYSIDRRVIGGSIKKNIAVCQPDYDSIIFFNEIQPPFDNVLEDMVYILRNMSSVTNIIKTRYSVGFLFNNELEVDVLPATNLASRKLKLDREEKIKNQQENVLKEMSGLQPNERKLWSSSVAESQVAFMEEQSDFVRTVVKLAKFWYKVLCCDEKLKVPGLKYLIELVAVFCAQEEENYSNLENRNRSVTQALAKMFKKLADTKKLTISFVDGCIASIRHGQRVVKKYSGFVVDPANPYNDILESVTAMTVVRRNKTAIPLLEKHSNEKFAELQKYLLKFNPKYAGYFGYLDVLFKPRVFENFVFGESYNFALCFTYFANHAEYLKQMKHIEIPEEIEDDIGLIERVFKVGAAIQNFKRSFTDGSGKWLTDDSGDMDTTVMATLECLQEGLINFLEDHVDMHHSKRVQMVFHPWGAQYAGPSVRSYKSGRISFTTKLKKILDENKNNVAVLHAPVWKGPCVVEGEDFGLEVLYCWCLVVF